MKLIATALPAALLAAGLATPSVASAAEPAPTNVQIAWKDSSLKQIHVTWDEAGPQPNVVFFQVIGKDKRYRVAYLAADAPNEVDIPAAGLYGFGTADKQIGVAAGTEAGDTSPVTLSARFDTNYPQPAELESFTMSGTNVLHVKWRDARVIGDDTTSPNDPLDQPATVLSQPRYVVSDGTITNLTAPGPAKEITFTGPNQRYGFNVSASNEWLTTAAGAFVYGTPAELKATVPTWNVFGNTAKISGTVAATTVSRQLVLQARNSPTSPWYVVTYGYVSGSFYFEVSGAGTRQYRLALVSQATKDTAYFGGYSAPVTMTVQQKAKATPASSRVYLGLTRPVWIDVAPAVNGSAVLQRWNGKTWVTVSTVAVKDGFGTGTVHGTTLGSAAYRYYVPAHAWRGLSVAATYTQQFVMTTIR
jgi:hypothetical protein